MRTAAALALLAGLTAGAQAAPERAFDLRVVEDVATGGFAEPPGMLSQRPTLRLRYRSDSGRAQLELPRRRLAGAQPAGLSPGAAPEPGRGDPRLKLTLPLPAAATEATGPDGALRWEFFFGRASRRDGGDVAAGVTLRAPF